MPQIKKIPYFTMEPSLNVFAEKTWKGHYGNQGCVPLDTQQRVAMDRLAPNEPLPPPEPLQPTAEQVDAPKDEQVRQKGLKRTAKPQVAKPENGSRYAQNSKTDKPPEAEECPRPPVFDMLDIPDAMDAMGWPVSAKCARKWFSSPKHIYNDKPNSVQPIDDTIVTLDWALRFGNVKKKYDELLSRLIYQEDAVFLAKKIHKEKTQRPLCQTGTCQIRLQHYRRDKGPAAVSPRLAVSVRKDIKLEHDGRTISDRPDWIAGKLWTICSDRQRKHRG